MSFFFCDSSALVKRYVHETGSTWIVRLLDPVYRNTVLVAEITRLEGLVAENPNDQPTNGQ